MFIAYRTADDAERADVERGIARYSQLYRNLLDIELEHTHHDLGPLQVHTLEGTKARVPVVQSNERRAVLLTGRPTCLASAGMDVHQFTTRLLEQDAISADDFVRELQGEFVAIVVDRANNRWEIAMDSVGLDQVYFWNAEGRLLISDTLYLLATTKPLELDPVGCNSLMLCSYIFGTSTLFKDTQALRMNEALSGSADTWDITDSYHFAEAQGGPATIPEVAEAYVDAAKPRFSPEDPIRHTITGGTDSRFVGALLSHLGLRPTYFNDRWDPTDVTIGHNLANELGLDYLSISGPRTISTRHTQQRSILAEALLLDGALRPPLPMATYIRDMPPNGVLTMGNFGASVLKYTWGVGYAGMLNPTPDKIVQRLVDYSAIENSYPAGTFTSDPIPAVKRYLAETMTHQAALVQGVDHVKLSNYLYLHNRGARWAAHTLKATNHLMTLEQPIAYAAAVATIWRAPSHLYKDIRMARELIHILEPRLTKYNFADGTPAYLDFGWRERLAVTYNRQIKKAVRIIKKQLFNIKGKKYQGLMRIPGKATPSSELIPRWAYDDDQRRTLHLFGSVGSNPNQVGAAKLKYILTFEMAARLYEGEITSD